MKTVRFVPNLEVGEIEATIILQYENRVVLLAQSRICVATLDGEIYRPLLELKGLDLYHFIHFGG
jgi:hypothetical protein